jgi:hypothetical protein
MEESHPPTGFNPIRKPVDQLKKYKFPLPPPHSARAGAIWQDILRGSHEYVRAPARGESCEPYLESKTWSGAIVPEPPPATIYEATERFYYITSTWIIPDACPPPCGEKPQNCYSCYCFVGFDGWVSDGPPALMWGTKSILEGGKHFAVVFLQYEGKQETFDTPWVNPGDLVSAVLKVEDNDYFTVYLVNHNTGKYTIFSRKLPADFRGATAEWILGRECLDYGNPGKPLEELPNYGATYYHKNYADSKSLRGQSVDEFTVDNAQLIDMIAAKSVDDPIPPGTVISTAEKVGKNLLYVYAYWNEDC